MERTSKPKSKIACEVVACPLDATHLMVDDRHRQWQVCDAHADYFHTPSRVLPARVRRKVEMKDLYREAVIEGIAEYRRQTESKTSLTAFDFKHLGPEGPSYWIARYAARKVADALLEKAKEMVTEEQWEALRVVAAEVAYD